MSRQRSVESRIVECGVVFERWVTPEDAELDLLRAARLN